jgi:hypothetical protein
MKEVSLLLINQMRCMVKKITVDNVNDLKDGDYVIKYPMFGEPMEEVDFENKEKLLLMQVGSIQDDRIDLIFPDTNRPMLLAGMVVQMGPLHKYKDEIVADKNWWIYTT